MEKVEREEWKEREDIGRRGTAESGGGGERGAYAGGGTRRPASRSGAAEYAGGGGAFLWVGWGGRCLGEVVRERRDIRCRVVGLWGCRGL